MNKSMKIIIVIILLTVSFLAGVGFTYSAAEKRFNAIISNTLLHELSNDISVLEILDAQSPIYSEINTQLNKNILETVLSVSTINLDVGKHDSISLETMCKVIKLNNEGRFKDVDLGGIEVLVFDYLKNVEEPILNEISKLQKLFKGKGCSTTVKR